MNELITVYSAEVLRRLQSRTFWAGLLFGVIGVLIMMRLPQFLDSYASQTKHIVLSGDTALLARAKPLLAKDYPASAEIGPLRRPPTTDELHAHNAALIIALSGGAGGVHVTAYAQDPSDVDTAQIRRDLLPLNLQMQTRMSGQRVHDLMEIPVSVRSVSQKFGTAAEANAAKGIAYLLLFLLYLLTMVNSQLIMSSVAEEKTSRIAELLVASVRPSTLLAGKVGASASLALLQMVVWVAAAYAFGMGNGPMPGRQSGQDVTFTLNGISPADVAGFAIFFLLGFFQMSTLFAAMGSLINRTEDLGSVSGPLFIPVIAAFFIGIAALEVPDSPGVVVTSFIPLIAPFVMFARIVVSSVPFWQVATSFVINAAAIWGIAVLGGKIYRIGMLLYGRPPKFSQILHLLRS